MIATTTDNRKQQYGRLNRKYLISARHGRKPQNCRWNFDAICHSSRDISISGMGGRIAISGCLSLSQCANICGTSFKFIMVENLELPLEFRRHLSQFQRNEYFRLGRPYCYFRLSVVLAITFWSKTPGCSWKRTHLLFFYLNSWGFLPQAQHCTCAQKQKRNTRVNAWTNCFLLFFLGSVKGPTRRHYIFCSVVVLEESPCPRGSIYKSLSLSLDHKVLENNFQGLRILQTVRCI